MENEDLIGILFVSEVLSLGGCNKKKSANPQDEQGLQSTQNKKVVSRPIAPNSTDDSTTNSTNEKPKPQRKEKPDKHG